MAAEDSRIRVRKEDGITRIEFVDRNILDEVNIHQIGEEINGLIDAEASPKLLIEFTNVDHLSSAALGTLITIHNRVKEREGQLRLAHIDPQIYEVFAITKLNMIFVIHDTTEDAAGSIG